MRTVCYLRIERLGEMDAEEVDSMLAPLSVERKRRKHVGMPIQTVPLEYWVTRRLESECDVAPGFVHEVTRAADVLRDRDWAGKISITAVVAPTSRKARCLQGHI